MGDKIIDSLANRIVELSYEVGGHNDNDENKRFMTVTPEETVALVQQQKNKNTQVTTSSHIRLFKEWLRQKIEFRDPYTIEPVELDSYFAQFFISVRKAKTKENNSDDQRRQYESSSLCAMQASFHRYLKDNKYEWNIKTDNKFSHSRDVLAAKMKELKQLGKGNHPQASQSFTNEELKAIFDKNLLGTSKFY